MDFKSKIKDECCAEELEEMVIGYIKAGFMSNDEISEDCVEYIEDNYPDECDNITEADLLEIIEPLRREFQNTGKQENFLKLESAFKSMRKHGIVALHYAGYTQSEGFEDCNEAASELHKNGERVVGCCFYTQQDLEYILNGYGGVLRFSYGNYFEKPTAGEIGKIIAEELRSAGFNVQWDGSSQSKIEIKDIKWDKHYSPRED